MTYKVDYSVKGQRRSAQVQAGSPQEAMVKFRYTQAERERASRQNVTVLSVSPEWVEEGTGSEEEAAW